VAEEAFGIRLRQLREAAGLSQQALADAAGVLVGAISRWERGTREPSWGNVRALCKALGVSSAAFEAEEDSQPTPEQPRGPGRPRKARDEDVESTPAKKTTRRRKT
jgi:transcriptional regulator with XRE-family HTH domain